jgi:hypothetical protein
MSWPGFGIAFTSLTLRLPVSTPCRQPEVECPALRHLLGRTRPPAHPPLPLSEGVRRFLAWVDGRTERTKFIEL